MFTSQKASPLPRLRGLPLLGNFFDLRHDRLGLMRRLWGECGPVCTLRLGPVPIVAVTDAALAHQVLVADEASYVKSKGLSHFARPLLGNGMLTSEHDVHRRQRRLLSPAFAPRRTATYADVMVAETEAAQATWADGSELDLADELMRLTLSIVGKTLFDTDLSSQASRVNDALTDAMSYIVNAVSSPLAQLVPYRWPLPSNQKMRRAVASLDETIYQIIARRRTDPSDHGDVLSMMTAARDDDGTGLTDVELRDQAMTLVLAGHETTANALAWAHYLLAEHPACYDRLVDEARTALGGRPPTYQDLPQLPYALAVLKESMRLYPPAYNVTRQASRDVELAGHQLHEGAFVLVNIYGMHRRPDYFERPDEFDPSRFLPDAEKRLPKGAFIPFGGGPRVCIGNHFALMEGQLILAALAQRLRVERSGAREPIIGEPLVTLRPRGGLPVKIRRQPPLHPSYPTS